jgi:tetratricopeptide (TPR) repeat protein
MKRFLAAFFGTIVMSHAMCLAASAAVNAPEPAVLKNPQFVSLILESRWKDAAQILSKDATWVADPRAALLVGHIDLAEGSYNKATFLFHSVTAPEDLALWKDWTSGLCSQHSESPIAHYLLGDACARLGQLDKAIDEFTTAIKIKPDCYLAYSARGLARSAQADITKKSNEEKAQNELSLAAEDFEDALAINKDFLDARANLAITFIQSGNADKTMTEFQKILDKDPTFAMAYNGMACALVRNGNYQEASSDVMSADSLCRTLYTMINAKALASQGSGSSKIKDIANAAPDSIMQKIRGYSPMSGTTMPSDIAGSGSMIADTKSPGAAEAQPMTWQDKVSIASNYIAGGASILVVLSPLSPLAKPIALTAISATNDFVQASMKYSALAGTRGGVYFESRVSKAGAPGILMTEAVLNYPRVLMPVVKQ